MFRKNQASSSLTKKENVAQYILGNNFTSRAFTPPPLSSVPLHIEADFTIQGVYRISNKKYANSFETIKPDLVYSKILVSYFTVNTKQLSC